MGMTSDMVAEISILLHDHASDKLKELQYELKKTGKAGAEAGVEAESGMARIGKAATLGIAGFGLAAAAGTAFSVKLAADLQESEDKIRGFAGASAKEMAYYKSAIMDASKQFGVSAKDISDGLYFVVSAGFKGRDAMDVLKASTEAAASSGSDMKTVADAVTSALNAYHLSGQQAKATTDTLSATVVQGKMNFQDLALAIARPLSVAPQLGATLSEVGGAMAQLTTHGYSARLAAMGLTTEFKSLLVPTKQQKDESTALGIKWQELYNVHGKGLVQTLKDIYEAAAKNTSGIKDATARHAEFNQEVKKLLGNGSAMATFLLQSGDGFKELGAKIKAVSDSAGTTDRAWEEAKKSFNTQLKLMQVAVEDLAIELGNTLLPKLTGIVNYLNTTVLPAVDAFSKAMERDKTWSNNLKGAYGDLVKVLSDSFSTWGQLIDTILPQYQEEAGKSKNKTDDLRQKIDDATGVVKKFSDMVAWSDGILLTDVKVKVHVAEKSRTLADILGNDLQSAIKAVGDAFGAAGNTLSGAFSSAIDGITSKIDGLLSKLNGLSGWLHLNLGSSGSSGGPSSPTNTSGGYTAGSTYGFSGPLTSNVMNGGSAMLLNSITGGSRGTVMDTDFGGGAQNVRLPGGKGAAYTLVKQYMDPDLGGVEVWRAKNGGEIMFLHMSQLAPVSVGQTVSGGTSAGRSGAPLTSRYGNTPGAYHLCVVTDAGGREYLQWLTEPQMKQASATPVGSLAGANGQTFLGTTLTSSRAPSAGHTVVNGGSSGTGYDPNGGHGLPDSTTKHHKAPKPLDPYYLDANGNIQKGTVVTDPSGRQHLVKHKSSSGVDPYYVDAAGQVERGTVVTDPSGRQHLVRNATGHAAAQDPLFSGILSPAQQRAELRAQGSNPFSDYRSTAGKPGSAAFTKSDELAYLDAHTSYLRTLNKADLAGLHVTVADLLNDPALKAELRKLPEKQLRALGLTQKQLAAIPGTTEYADAAFNKAAKAPGVVKAIGHIGADATGAVNLSMGGQHAEAAAFEKSVQAAVKQAGLADSKTVFDNAKALDVAKALGDLGGVASATGKQFTQVQTSFINGKASTDQLVAAFKASQAAASALQAKTLEADRAVGNYSTSLQAAASKVSTGLTAATDKFAYDLINHTGDVTADAAALQAARAASDAYTASVDTANRAMGEYSSSLATISSTLGGNLTNALDKLTYDLYTHTGNVEADTAAVRSAQQAQDLYTAAVDQAKDATLGLYDADVKAAQAAYQKATQDYENAVVAGVTGSALQTLFTAAVNAGVALNTLTAIPGQIASAVSAAVSTITSAANSAAASSGSSSSPTSGPNSVKSSSPYDHAPNGNTVSAIAAGKSTVGLLGFDANGNPVYRDVSGGTRTDWLSGGYDPAGNAASGIPMPGGGTMSSGGAYAPFGGGYTGFGKNTPGAFGNPPLTGSGASAGMTMANQQYWAAGGMNGRPAGYGTVPTSNPQLAQIVANTGTIAAGLASTQQKIIDALKYQIELYKQELYEANVSPGAIAAGKTEAAFLGQLPAHALAA